MLRYSNIDILYIGGKLHFNVFLSQKLFPVCVNYCVHYYCVSIQSIPFKLKKKKKTHSSTHTFTVALLYNTKEVGLLYGGFISISTVIQTGTKFKITGLNYFKFLFPLQVASGHQQTLLSFNLWHTDEEKTAEELGGQKHVTVRFPFLQMLPKWHRKSVIMN